MPGMEGMTEGMEGGVMPEMPTGGEGMEGGPGMLGTRKDLDADLKANRYVDKKLNPLENPDDPATRPFAEFRMMPVRMELVMDQRRIPELLVNLANSPMSVETKRVSLQPGTGIKVRLDRPTGGGVGFGEEGGYSAGARRRGGGMGLEEGMGMGRGSDQETSVSAYDMPIEILGVVYIYEVPNREELGTGTAGQEEEEVAAAPAVTPPAAAPPAEGAPPAVPPGEGAPPAEPPPATEPAPGAGPGPGGPAAEPAPAGGAAPPAAEP
jgi:hypothetical protein